MIKIRDSESRAGETPFRGGSLCRMKFRGERAGGDSPALWARRAAGAALILFGLAVLVSNLVGGS